MFNIGKETVSAQVAAVMFVAQTMQFAEEYAPYIKQGVIKSLEKLGEEDVIEISEDAALIAYFCTIASLEMLVLENKYEEAVVGSIEQEIEDLLLTPDIYPVESILLHENYIEYRNHIRKSMKESSSSESFLMKLVEPYIETTGIRKYAKANHESDVFGNVISPIFALSISEALSNIPGFWSAFQKNYKIKIK